MVSIGKCLNKEICRVPWAFPGGAVVKNLPANIWDLKDAGTIPGLGRFPWSRKWQSAPVFLPGKFHGQRSLEGSSSWGRKELDTTEWLNTHVGDTSGKEPTWQCRRHKGCQFDPWVRKISWKQTWRLTPVYLLRESYGQRSLEGYSPEGWKRQTGLKQLSMHTPSHI